MQLHKKSTISTFLVLMYLLLLACETQPMTNDYSESPKIVGTWKLLKGLIIENGDSVVTDYTTNQELIKIINDTHFAFLRHDLTQGKDSIAIFVAGGGTYTLSGNRYTEVLTYCNYREWENHEFEFEVTYQGDTLITNGIERVESLQVDRINIETYIRVK